MNIYSFFRRLSRAGRRASGSLTDTTAWVDFNGDDLIDLSFEELRIDHARLRNCRLPRPPLWSEIYDALLFTSDNYIPVGVTGPFIRGSIPGEFGKCLFFATMTKAILDLLTNSPSGLAVGGIALGIRGRADGHYFMPPDVKSPNLLTGGFHAWAGVEHEGTPYLIDLSYHWFHRGAKPGAECCGPKRFFVTTEERLKQNRIYYNTDAGLTQFIKDTYSMESLADPLCDCVAYMRDVLMKLNN
ncbi:hypothetical protein [Azospirillum soli]|uniref:hypothetical protein n=1 Tax=Azospirillum soli TaxID=1304799 RepID=UPI001AE509BC|nr:hypothetical protein [Azospirillum soli]MBP2311501.1 hypothetical protein [Azospirillum soli]